MGHTKIIQSGNTLEIYQYEKSLSPRIRESRPRKPRKTDKRFRYARLDNVKRRSKSFLRLVRSNLIGDLRPFLLTLTMFEDLGIKRSYSLLTVFISRLRKDFGPGFRYVAVPEFQKRGAVHFHLMFWGLPPHLACKGYMDRSRGFNRFIHECESGQCERHTRYFSRLWQRGFVDSLQTDGSPKLATYLAKYMSKSMSDKRLLGEKSYCASRNVYRSSMVSSSVALDYAPEIWGFDLSTVKNLHYREFDTQWLGKGRYTLIDLENIQNESDNHTPRKNLI